jgi:hypothetical protein
MSKQHELFGFRDMTPWAKKGIKKIITRERLKEVQELLAKDPRGAAAKLREMREKLEAFDRRINNKKK